MTTSDGLNGHMPTGTFTLVETYTTIACPKIGCGVSFAVNDDYRDRRVDDHESFYCPNGHSMSYGHENKAEKEARLQRERADRLAKTVERREADLRFEQNRLIDERKSHAATKGKLTKTRNRAAHALCPVEGCHRSFANVARHVASQHPEFSA